jgi:arabinogalactan oligomer/maltooligosaccharide transport system permease protein
MNIPSDLYESARIDGAGTFTQFTKITLPYMLFVTGPYLITQFIGNINNFNVIFFLTGGDPSANIPGVQYGKTDILVTWLYDLTVNGAQQQYAIGSALGIFIFLISVFITLALYSKTSAATQEGDFA